MKRSVSVVAILLLSACQTGSSAPANPPAASQAATAVAAANPVAQPPPQGPPPVSGVPPATRAAVTGGAPLEAAGTPGRMVVIRDTTVEVVEKGARRTVFTAAAGGSVKDPRWSPDGKQIAFAYAPPRPPTKPNAPITDQLLFSDVMVVPADGGDAKAVALHDGPGAILETPAWSSDGKSVFFSYYAPTYKGQDLIGETIEVRRVDVAGGTPSTVVKQGSSPIASPDGTLLAYVAEDAADGPSVRVVTTDGKNERTLVKAGDFAGLLAPRFSPDGKTLSFSGAAFPKAAGVGTTSGILDALLGVGRAEAHGLPWEIWTVPVAGGQPKQLTQFAEDTPYASWSADGARLLVFAAGGLYMVDAASGSTQSLSTDGAHGGMDWRSG